MDRPPPAWPDDASRYVVRPRIDRTGPIITLLAAVAGVVGSIAPWAIASDFSANGTDGDGHGYLTLALMVLVATLAGIALMQKRNLFGGTVFILALITAAIALVDLARIDGADSVAFLGTTVNADPGWGLWLLVLAAIGAGAGGFITAYRSYTTP